MQREPVHYITTKLSGEWSAANFTSTLSKDLLTVAVEKFEKLDPSVRVRLLLWTLFLRPASIREMADELQQLCQVAAEDEDEWVRVIGRAVAKLNGFLDFRNVKEHSKEVNDSVNKLKGILAGYQQTGFEPLELAYLNPHLVPREIVDASVPSQEHFRLREGAGDVAKELAQPVSENETERYPSVVPDKASNTPGQKNNPSFRKSSGVDMFLSSKPTNPFKPLANIGSSNQAYPEKKGLARATKIKQIDVAEVKVLNRQPSRMERAESKYVREADQREAFGADHLKSSSLKMNSSHLHDGTGTLAEGLPAARYDSVIVDAPQQTEEMEAGEIEAGELPLEPGPKKQRMHE